MPRTRDRPLPAGRVSMTEPRPIYGSLLGDRAASSAWRGR